ncbi:YveK family protein [Fictibacillus sp. KU28468]|uniref:YveK family protein n=1 Tax=Fictibacillus sp. KU28468 TaxID=2991053 RepID=UPI00223E2E3E|nr:Wzz/FepE/Etk N-terminal domain-containing protein [Fictibacillus sp. KU28468]UZJ79335.1 Wzz/FepE/Etk N-terminal domain-containing protein [Fictibacillus sp. KU28468]
MEETISLKEIYQTIRKRIRLIALITIVAVAISGAVSYFVLTPIYQSSTQILVNQQKPDKQQALDYNQVQTNVQMVNTYSVIIKSPAILSKVIQHLDLKQSVADLNNQLTINSEQDTQIMNVTVQDPDPALAARIANGISHTFKTEIPNIMDIDNVSILSPADLSDSPVKPNAKLNMAIALVVGLMTGVGLAFLLEYLDNTLKSEQDIEHFLGLPVLGTIPKMTLVDEKDNAYQRKAV